MQNIPVPRLIEFVTNVFHAAGTTPDIAELVATSLVNSNLAGHDSHGVIRVMQYLQHIESGELKPTAMPQVVRETASVTIVEGGYGFGQHTAHFGMTKAIAKAKEHGLAITNLTHCQHVGRLGEWVEMAAAENLIGLAFCNGGREGGGVAPFGGRERRLGTNPIAAAIPVADQAPIVVDFATSASAEGKLRVARNSGKSIPEGWIFNRDGEPSTDPNDYYNDGMLLTAADHKGYGLSLLVEYLGGILSGNGAPAVPGFQFGNGVFLQAIDVGVFRPIEEFLQESATLCARIKSTASAPGFKEVLLPGEPEARTRAARMDNGIPIDDVTWSQLVETGAGFGVTA